MPKGIEVVVDGGFATIDFTDPGLVGTSLGKLIAVGGPGTIETLTRQGPRRLYRVPEGNAREAGLIDKHSQVDAHPVGDTGAAAALQRVGSAGARPEPTTVRGRAYVGTTPSAEVLASLTPRAAAAYSPPSDDDELPDQSWSRHDLDTWAAIRLDLDTTGLPNKAAVLEAINEET